MKGYTSEMIRNVALLGHGGCGKTTFLEAALLATGVISRLGKVEDGTTVSDYDKMEIEKGYSINTSCFSPLSFPSAESAAPVAKFPDYFFKLLRTGIRPKRIRKRKFTVRRLPKQKV